MRMYQAWMKSDGATKCVEIQADDVNLDVVNDVHFWNFTVRGEGEDDVTVAAFPHLKVDYIVALDR